MYLKTEIVHGNLRYSKWAPWRTFSLILFNMFYKQVKSNNFHYNANKSSIKNIFKLTIILLKDFTKYWHRRSDGIKTCVQLKCVPWWVSTVNWKQSNLLSWSTQRHFQARWSVLGDRAFASSCAQRQKQHHLGTCQECKVLDPIPDQRIRNSAGGMRVYQDLPVILCPLLWRTIGIKRQRHPS